MTELASVVDLARAMGLELDQPSIVRLDVLRAVAVTTWPLDTREVYWAMERAVALVELLERERLEGSAVADPEPAPLGTPSTGTDGPTVTPAGPQVSSGGTTDVDVTVHCDDERRPTVSTTRDQSASER